LWTLAQRFQKFVVVGAVGLAVNQGVLWFLHESSGMNLVAASPIAIMVSMVVTFFCNEMWTWHDRGTGRISSRAMSYVPINFGGLVLNWGALYVLTENTGMHWFAANLIGAGIAAIWNFTLNNMITWRA